jgi:hypothetical protein
MNGKEVTKGTSRRNKNRLVREGQSTKNKKKSSRQQKKNKNRHRKSKKNGDGEKRKRGGGESEEKKSDDDNENASRSKKVKRATGEEKKSNEFWERGGAEGDYADESKVDDMDIEYIPPEPEEKISNVLRTRIINKYKGIPMEETSTKFDSMQSAMIKINQEVKNKYIHVLELYDRNVSGRELEKKDDFTKATLDMIRNDENNKIDKVSEPESLFKFSGRNPVKPKLNVLEKLRNFVNKPPTLKYKEIDMFYMFSKRDALPIIEITSFTTELAKPSLYEANKEELLDAMNNLSDIAKTKLTTEFKTNKVEDEQEFETINEVKFSIRKEIVNAVNKFADFPEECTMTSQIPLYFVVVVGATRGIHVTICILVNHQMYTFGFVYIEGEDTEQTIYVKNMLNKIPEGFLKKNFESLLGINLSELHFFRGGLYTPDLIFEPSKVPGFENKIIDIGILTKANIENLSKYTNAVTKIRTTLDSKTMNDESFRTTTFYKFKSHELFLDVSYYEASSSLITAGKNCANFITTIFPNVNCEILKADPKNCRSEKNLDNNKINEIFKVYINNDVKSLRKMITPTSFWSFFG